ncbi:hypothetical protein GCM10027355_11440 [Haloplanus salinarum]
MWHDLVVFQRDCLVAVATLAIERDLIAKTGIDGRTNGYAPTDAGREAIRVGVCRLTNATEEGEC